MPSVYYPEGCRRVSTEQVGKCLRAQVFMMPGSSFMNVLAGSLYGTTAAVPLVAFLSTAGSSGSYWLSRLVVKVGPAFFMSGMYRWR